MESMQRKSKVRIGKFSANFDSYRLMYELFIDDGKISHAVAIGSRHRKVKAYSQRYKNFDNLRAILEGLMFVNGVDVLKHIYDSLDEGEEKDFVRNLRNEIVAKLTF